MEALLRTLLLLCTALLLWEHSIAECRPLHPKKHSNSHSKHHQHHKAPSKNAIMHPLDPASLRELAFDSHKAARETLPFPFQSLHKQPTSRHHKPSLEAFKPVAPVEVHSEETGFGPDVETQKHVGIPDGFGHWAPQGTVNPSNDRVPNGGFEGFEAPSKTKGSKTPDVDGFGAWGAFQPDHQAQIEDAGFGGNSRKAGGTSQAIHFVPGQAPHVVEESIGPDGFGTLISSSDDSVDVDVTPDGWFMSFVPYPQPTRDQEAVAVESSSSSAPFADMWGLYRDRKRGCDKSMEGRPCSSNADCYGCHRTFHCSTNNTCQRV